MSPLVALLTKQGDSGGGGDGGSSSLSGGAIAGIAVGAAVGAAALVGFAWVLRRRRRRGPIGGVLRMAPTSDGATDSATKLSSAPTIGSYCQPRPQGAATAFSPARMGSGGGAVTVGSGGGSTMGSGGGAGHSRGGHSGTALSSSSGGPPSSRNLPELAEHIAAVEARSLGLFDGGPRADQHSMLEVPQPPLLSVDSLPSSLTDWVVDLTEVTFSRRTDGSLAELGRGAR